MRFLTIIALVLACAVVTPARSQPDFSEPLLRSYLQAMLLGRNGEKDETIRYDFAPTQLAPRRPSAILVYIERSNHFCGSGGCPLYVLMPDGESFRKISTISISRPPIMILNHRTNGWKDIAVLVCGGGILGCYEAALPFDGKKYAINPSVPPARRLAAGPPGRIVIRAGDGKPLY